MSNINNPEAMKPVATRIESTLDAGAQPIPPRPPSVHPLVIRYEGSITAPETGDYNLGMKASGFFRVHARRQERDFLLRRRSLSIPGLGRFISKQASPPPFKVDYAPMKTASPIAQLVWSKVDLSPQPEAIEAAKNADVVVAVVGITSELEGEEMQVQRARLQGRRPHQHRSAQARRGSA